MEKELARIFSQGLKRSCLGGGGEITTGAAKQDDVAKSIAESVGGTLQFAEGNFLGVAEAMPEDKYSCIPTAGNFDGVAASANR